MKISTVRFAFSILLVYISCIIISGCGASKVQRGASIGAGAGATVGALIGRTAGNVALGTIIGGAIGGTAGAYIGHKMDYALPGDKPDITGASVSRENAGYRVKFDSGLMFDKGGANLSVSSQTNIKNLANYLRREPQNNVTIIGYTDTLGTGDYNKDLSLRRAEAVKTILVADSVSADRLVTQGSGGANPISDNTKPDQQAGNRQVEIIVTSNDKAKAQAKNN